MIDKVAPATQVGMKAALDRFRATTGNIPIGAITARHIDLFTAQRRQQVSPTTVNVDLRYIRAALFTAVRWGYLTVKPAIRLMRIDHAFPIYLDKPSFQKLFGLVTEPWLRELMLFSVATGLRRSELVVLRWQEVDMDRHDHDRVPHQEQTGPYRAVEQYRHGDTPGETSCLSACIP